MRPIIIEMLQPKALLVCNDYMYINVDPLI